MSGDDVAIEALAKAAGLDIAWARFRDDVIAALQNVQTSRRVLGALELRPTDEPWPSMQIKTEP